MRIEHLEVGNSPLHARDSKGRFGIQKGPSPDKLLRDAQRLKKLARWVLVIDEQGKILNLISNDPCVANVIAVLGPVISHGVALPEALLLEVGISRGRPYMQAESHRNGGRAIRLYIKGRSKAADITLEQLKSIWSMIVSIIEESVTASRSQWASKEGWYVSTAAGVKCFERGICFSISRMDRIVHEAFLSRDVDVRKYLHKNAGSIRYFLRRYKYVYYPEKQLKSLAGVLKVVELWKGMTSSTRWSQRYAHRVVKSLPSAARALFQHIADVYNLNTSAEDEADQPVQTQARRLIFPEYLHIRWEREGKYHGKNCSLFEVFFARSYSKEKNI